MNHIHLQDFINSMENQIFAKAITPEIFKLCTSNFVC